MVFGVRLFRGQGSGLQLILIIAASTQDAIGRGQSELPKPKKPKKAITDEESAERNLQKPLKSLLDMVNDIFFPLSLDPWTRNLKRSLIS